MANGRTGRCGNRLINRRFSNSGDRLGREGDVELTQPAGRFLCRSVSRFERLPSQPLGIIQKVFESGDAAEGAAGRSPTAFFIKTRRLVFLKRNFR